MKFCIYCSSILTPDTSRGTLVFKCGPCNETFPCNDIDSLREEIDYMASESSEKFKVMESNAPFDTAAKRVKIECPKCNNPLLTHIYIGVNYVSQYVCECGYSILSRNLKGGEIVNEDVKQ